MFPSLRNLSPNEELFSQYKTCLSLRNFFTTEKHFSHWEIFSLRETFFSIRNFFSQRNFSLSEKPSYLWEAFLSMRNIFSCWETFFSLRNLFLTEKKVFIKNGYIFLWPNILLGKLFSILETLFILFSCLFSRFERFLYTVIWIIMYTNPLL